MAKEAETTGGEIMLFGVRVVVDSLRKSVSLNNLSQYEHRLDSSSSNDVVIPPATAAGYASADDAAVVNNASAVGGGVSRERKRGVPWTEDEHKLFLLGLNKVGKGDWRGISRNFVKTRTPTQVASHAQKYFLRRNNLNRRRRRSSLFDITTDSVTVNQSNDKQIKENNNNGGSPSPLPSPQQQQSSTSEISTVRFSSPGAPIYPLTTSFSHLPPPPPPTQVIDHEMKVVMSTNSSTTSSKSMVDFDLNQNDSSSLSLSLSLSMTSSDLANSRYPAFQVMQGFKNGDSSIRVA
ncbi:transcription factor MYB1R1-like [Chenopodium quinoa]|uniref:transcription factor MYB1R1-like n=1 Tax=Chenopodium quinoa TaxID=63459 RepID=UPI000B775751|nr:transcription factor MYB1R1-like [Chenopodium quinoa]